MQLAPRILVLDDDETILEFIGEVLADEGYETLVGTNGAEGLALTASSPPALILLDMRMPVMDGWEFAAAYRRRPGPHAPIVVISAARDAARLAAEIGADGYLAKPFDLDALLAEVGRFAPMPHRGRAPGMGNAGDQG